MFTTTSPSTAHPPALRRGLYLVTRETDDTARLVQVVRAALTGGAVLVQYRDKSSDTARRLEQALALQALCAAHGVPLLINDDVALALRVDAAGVHLGEHDTDPAAARALLGPAAIIGVSCYDSLERARELARAGPSYLAFGAFFPSSTKPGARRAAPELLVDARALGLPLAAIGGIEPANALPLLAAGTDLLAVVSWIFDAPDPLAATRALAKCFHEHATPATEPSPGLEP